MVGQQKKVLTINTEYNAGSYQIHVTVSDTGAGIPDDVKDKVFNAFYTTKSEQKDTDIGLAGDTGLGLSSSVSLLVPYNAEISFVTKLNKGTSFKVKIPVGVNKYDSASVT